MSKHDCDMNYQSPFSKNRQIMWLIVAIALTLMTFVVIIYLQSFSYEAWRQRMIESGAAIVYWVKMI